MRRRVIFAIVLLGCGGDDVTGFHGIAGSSMAWSAKSDTVAISNLTSHDVRYALIGRTWMHNALIEWCFGFGECGTVLPAKASAQVPYDHIDGAAAPEREAMLVWWTPSGTSSVPFDTLVVRIR
jgi:hypothetical protein